MANLGFTFGDASQASPMWAARRIVCSADAPTQIGGRGRWAGTTLMAWSSMSKKRPWWVTRSPVQSFSSSSNVSTMRGPRVVRSTPNESNSSSR